MRAARCMGLQDVAQTLMSASLEASQWVTLVFECMNSSSGRTGKELCASSAFASPYRRQPGCLKVKAIRL
eukprot:6202260-Pleurochrysis_carterae.AAC.3